MGGEAADDVVADAGFGGGAGAGGDADALGGEAGDFLDGDFVVALHEGIGAEFAEVLDEVVGKGVVVVDDEEHRAGRSVEN